jgi:hypothetical protein
VDAEVPATLLISACDFPMQKERFQEAADNISAVGDSGFLATFGVNGFSDK